MNHSISKLESLYKKEYGEEYLKYLDNDISLCLNDFDTINNSVSNFLRNHTEIFELLCISVDETRLKEHIDNVWYTLSSKKQEQIFNFLYYYHKYITIKE
jgi:hypothetical protein